MVESQEIYQLAERMLALGVERFAFRGCDVVFSPQAIARAAQCRAVPESAEDAEANRQASAEAREAREISAVLGAVLP